MFSGKTKRGVGIRQTKGMGENTHQTTWVVVADQTHARVYEWTANKSLQLVDEMDNPEGKMKGSDLTSDRPGRTFESFSRGGNRGAGEMRHSYSKETDPKKKVVATFSAEVCHYLENARKEDKLKKLVFVANSSFLGLLQQNLDDLTRRCIVATFDKDYAWLQGQDIVERVTSLLVEGLE